MNCPSFFQKIIDDPRSNGLCQDMRGVHLSRKELVSIFYATLDLIRTQSNFHLTIPSKNLKIAYIYIYIKNKSCPKRRCLKSTKTISRPFHTSNRRIPNTFPINKCWQGSSWRPLTQFQKIRILVNFRVWKSYFESGPIFSKDFLNVQTRMD